MGSTGNSHHSKSPLKELLKEYAQDHQNLTNQKIHLICVPLIVWSLLGLFWFVPMIKVSFLSKPINLAMVFVLGSLIYYFYLAFKSFLLMLFVSGIFLSSIIYLEQFAWAIYLYLIVFIFAWIGQFIGHKIEGKKPSFLKDVHFLFIGPLWVFHKLKKS